jgi:hypothetical protein
LGSFHEFAGRVVASLGDHKVDFSPDKNTAAALREKGMIRKST